MFRSLPGFKAKYDELNLLVVREFDEWKVLVYSPNVTIHGSRQFSEPKAKEHALQVAHEYLGAMKPEAAAPAEVAWQPADHDDWLIWRG